ncbi:MAG: hypothetical protein HOV67_27840 [Kribbellaceae bacterium]|nr:hypothetical protein [Kribbellaceae bacterium]
MQILVPHLGFGSGPGRAVVLIDSNETWDGEAPGPALLRGPETVALTPGPFEWVPGWVRVCARIELPDELAAGTYVVRAPAGEEWRWAEQWIPHTAWYLLAVASAD